MVNSNSFCLFLKWGIVNRKIIPFLIPFLFQFRFQFQTNCWKVLMNQNHDSLGIWIGTALGQRQPGGTITQPSVLTFLTIPVQKGSATEPGLPARELRGPDGQHALQWRREVRPRPHVPPLALDRTPPSKYLITNYCLHCSAGADGNLAELAV